MVAPVLFEHRPEHLVEVFAAAADRSPQDAFLHGAQLAKRAVAAAVLQQHARLEPVRADRAEREGSDEARRFHEHAACRAPTAPGAFPFGGFEARIELAHLQQAGEGARGGERDDVGDRGAARALARGAVDQFLDADGVDRFVEAEAGRVADASAGRRAGARSCGPGSRSVIVRPVSVGSSLRQVGATLAGESDIFLAMEKRSHVSHWCDLKQL